ncbi:hypothetical protein Tco_0208124, partial [Tanacetum coccineum]
IQANLQETRKICKMTTRPKEVEMMVMIKVKENVSDLVTQVTSIGECSKPPKNNDQRAFIGGAWSNNGENEVEKTKDETCLVAQAPDEICLGVNLESCFLHTKHTTEVT